MSQAAFHKFNTQKKWLQVVYKWGLYPPLEIQVKTESMARTAEVIQLEI